MVSAEESVTKIETPNQLMQTPPDLKLKFPETLTKEVYVRML